MKVQCFHKLADATPKVEYDADSVETKSLTPFHHEVVLTKDGKPRLVEVNGEPRQGTSPERYEGVRVLRDDGIVQSVHATDGRANGGEDPKNAPAPEAKAAETRSPAELEDWIDSMSYQEIAKELEKRKITPMVKMRDRVAQLRKAVLV